MSKHAVMTEHLHELPASPVQGGGWPWDSVSAAPPDPAFEWPRISLVTPSFQQAATIEKTLRSVLLQNYPNLEYIVMDGGSTDGTVEILKKYAARLTYWVSEPDGGQSHAINKGLERCTGDIFNWLNSDDTLEPGALLEVGRLWKTTQTMILSGGCDNIDTEGKLQHRWIARPPRRLRDFFVPHAVVLAQPSTFLRTSAVRCLGGIREDLECVMDWDLYVRLLLNAPTHWTTEKTRLRLALALQHPEAKTQRLAALFPKEALRLMDDWLHEAPSSERGAILARRKSMTTQALITTVAAQPGPLGPLIRLPFQNAEVLSHRFYWGALRRALGAF